MARKITNERAADAADHQVPCDASGLVFDASCDRCGGEGWTEYGSDERLMPGEDTCGCGTPAALFGLHRG